MASDEIRGILDCGLVVFCIDNRAESTREERITMAEINKPSDSPQRALPAQSSFPQITGLSTAFPMEIESQPESSPHRKGVEREPRRHESGQ